MTALTSASPQRGRADSAVLRAEPLVQVQQIGWQLGGNRGAAISGLGRQLAELGEGGVPAGRHRLAVSGDLGTLGRRGPLLSLRALAALHYIQDDFLQVTLTVQQRGDLGLKVFQLAGRRYLAGVKPGLIPLDPAPHLVDVGLCLALLAPQVAFAGGQGGQRIAELAVAPLDSLEFRVLGQGASAMLEPAQLSVQVSKLEQPLLRVGGSFHGATLACRPGAVACQPAGVSLAGHARRQDPVPGRRRTTAGPPANHGRATAGPARA